MAKKGTHGYFEDENKDTSFDDFKTDMTNIDDEVDKILAEQRKAKQQIDFFSDEPIDNNEDEYVFDNSSSRELKSNSPRRNTYAENIETEEVTPETKEPQGSHSADTNDSGESRSNRSSGSSGSRSSISKSSKGSKDKKTVPLDQLDGLQRRSRALHRRRQHLVHRRRAARDRAHERVDPVVRPQGVRLALEDEERPALAGDRPPRVPVERREVRRVRKEDLARKALQERPAQGRRERARERDVRPPAGSVAPR